jgi:hypothetical protein
VVNGTRGLTGLFLCAILLNASADATQIVPMTLGETVREASAIAVVRVDAATARWGDESRRWILTDLTVTVEDALLADGEVETGRTVVLTFWGGTIGNETQAIAGIELPAPDDRLLVMLDPARRERFTPVVGLTQGLFRIRSDAGTGLEMVYEADGGPLRKSAAAIVSGFSSSSADERLKARPADQMIAATFVAALRAQMDVLRATPRVRLATVKSDVPLPRRIPMVDSRLAKGDGGRAPDDGDGPADGPDSGVALAAAEAFADPQPRPKYSVLGRAAVPIVVNQLPRSFTPWSPEDEYLMSRWNYYSEIFRVRTTPGNSYAWPDGVFDLTGFPSSADLQRVYGRGWASNELGVTVLRYSGNLLVEADVSLNPAFAWTMNQEAIYSSTTSAQSYRQTMLHELGHMFGAEHNFNALSIMNYMPAAFRAYALPYNDDAEAIRAVYGGPSRTDLGIYLYRANGFRSVTDATFPTAATAGTAITIRGFHLENVGTELVSRPTIEWYLTRTRAFGGEIPMGSVWYPPLARFTHFTPETIAATVTIPAGTPSGSYYLAAFIRGDGGPGQSGFPYSNNMAFSRFPIWVDHAPLAPPSPYAPLTDTTVRRPTFFWMASATASWYRLSIDVGGTNLIDRWFSAGDSNCPFGGLCWAAPGVELPLGAATFRVAAWNTVATSAWSGPGHFAIVLPRTRILSLFPPSAVTTGGTVRLWARVQNTGTEPLPPGSRAWFYVDGPAWTGDNWVGSADIAGFGSGVSEWVFVDWVVPLTAAGGHYSYRARVYAGGPASDWSAAQGFTVLTPPRPAAAVLALSQVNAGTVARGSDALLWARVANTGTLPLPAGTKVWFYVDGPAWTGDHWVGATSVDELAPGASAWYSFTWPVALSGPAGRYTYWAQVWATGAISPWSPAQSFEITAPLSSSFILLGPPAGHHVAIEQGGT